MNPIFRDDFEITESQKSKLSKKIDDIVNVNYGTLITVEQLEEILGFDRSQEKDWAFGVLGIMQIIRDRRFFCTTRGKEGNLYILKAEEMSLFNERKNKAASKEIRNRLKSLCTIDSSKISEEDQKRLDFEILRSGDLAVKMSDTMKKRLR